MLSARRFSLFIGLIFPLISACGGGGGGSPGPDTRAPQVEKTIPDNDAINVSPLCSITAEFNEPLDLSSVTSTSFTVRPEGGSNIPGTVRLIGTRIAQFEPASPLDKGQRYFATLTTAITDRAGNPLAGDHTWTFTVLSDGIDEWQAIPAGGPSERRDHSSVWTGKEMIVWGGRTTFGITSSGFRYDPCAGTWSATANAPFGLSGHTAVWTGTELIVWGGRDASGQLTNRGARYNPSNDTWTPVSTTNAPPPREGHTTVWTGSEMIVWGGDLGAPNGLTNTGARYNPSTNAWTPLPDAPFGLSNHTAVWTKSEMIVWGGHDVSGLSNRGARYRPSADSWTVVDTTNAPSAREGHTAVWTGSEMIVWGGSDGLNLRNDGGVYFP